MYKKIKIYLYSILRKSEKWTKTDMVYLAKGAYWLTIANIVSSASSFLLSIAFANLLLKETYGLYTFILSIVGILTIPTMAGINTALTSSVARGFEGSVIPALKTRIKWGLLGGLASIAVAGYYFINDNITLTICFLIGGIFIPLMNPLTVYGSFLAGKKLFKESSFFSSITKIVAAALMIATLFITSNIFIIILVYFSSYTFMRLLILFIILKRHKTNDKKEADTISYGKHLTVMNVFGTIVNQLDKLLMWHFLGATQLAIYVLALAPTAQIRSFLDVAKPLAFPKLSTQDGKVLKKTLPIKMIKLLLIIILIVVAFCFVAPYLYHLFFPKYLESIGFAQFYILILLFYPQKFMGQALTAHKKKRALYMIATINPIVKLALLITLIPLYGINGAIAAQILPLSVNTVLASYYFKKI